MRSIPVGPVRAQTALRAALIVTALACAAAFSSQASAQTKKLRVAYTGQPANIAVVVAKEQGFYQKHGLDVTLTPQTSSNQAQISLGKQFDITNATITNLIGMPYGFNPLLIAGQDYSAKGKYSSTTLMVEKGINSYKQLKGKTIGIVATGTGVQYVAFLIAMKKAGLKPSDYKTTVVPFPNMLDSLRAGRIDAAVAIEPFVGQMKAAGYGELGNPLFSVSKVVPSTIWMAKSSEVKKDPKKFKAFYQAYTETLRWMKSHDSEWKQIAASTLGLAPAVANRTVLFPYVQPKIRPSLIKVWVKPMYEVGLIPRRQYKALRDVNKLIYKP